MRSTAFSERVSVDQECLIVWVNTFIGGAMGCVRSVLGHAGSIWATRHDARQ
jgi:hypothetical protein